MKKSSKGCLLFTAIFAIILIHGCTQKSERIQSARKYIYEWNYERALSELISYREDKDATIQYLLGYCYLRKNEIKEATHYFANSLSQDSAFKDSIVIVYNKLAKNALQISDANRAVLFYQELANLLPDAVQAKDLFLVGDVNYEQGNYAVVILAYRKALAIDSVSQTARKARVKLVRALAASDSLMAALRLATKEYDRSKIAENVLLLGEVKYAIGKNFLKTEKYDSAKYYFREVLGQQEPKSLLDDAYFYLGEVHLHEDSISSALEAYKKVLRLNPYQKGDIVLKAQERIQEIKGRL